MMFTLKHEDSFSKERRGCKKSKPTVQLCNEALKLADTLLQLLMHYLSAHGLDDLHKTGHWHPWNLGFSWNSKSGKPGKLEFHEIHPSGGLDFIKSNLPEASGFRKIQKPRRGFFGYAENI